MARRPARAAGGLILRRFDVVLARLDPVIGAEIGKTRPVVILSPDETNQALRTVIAAALTSRRRAWPTRVPVDVAGVAGDIALDQMRAIDKRRIVQALGTLSANEAQAVLARLTEMFR